MSSSRPTRNERKAKKDDNTPSPKPLRQQMLDVLPQIIFSGFILWYTDFWPKIIWPGDPNLHRATLALSHFLLSITFTSFFYLEFFRPLVLKEPRPDYKRWEQNASLRKWITASTFSGLSAFILYCVSFSGVFGWWTVLIAIMWFTFVISSTMLLVGFVGDYILKM